MKQILLFTSITVFLYACGGSSDGGGAGTIDPDRQTEPPDYSSLEPASIATEALKPASEEEFSSYLKNGIRLQLPRASTIDSATADQGIAITANSNEDSSSSAFSDNFSTTNVHVAGVDESDFVKYDGRHLYISTFSNSFGAFLEQDWQPRSTIRIMKTEPMQAAVHEVGEIVLDNDWAGASELYLVENDRRETGFLAIIRNSWSFFGDFASTTDIAEMGDTVTTSASVVDPLPPVQLRSVQLSLYDVTDPTLPKNTWNLAIDGHLRGSRKIDNMLYLITDYSLFYSPFFHTLNFTASSVTEWTENEQRLAAVSIDDLMPKYTVNDSEAQPLILDRSCLVPTDLQGQHGYFNLMIITAIDLSKAQITSSTCLNANINGIYSSENNLYLGGSSYNSWRDFKSSTVLHKFNLNKGDIEYRATAVLPGTIGWRDPAFRMDEYQGDLRIVTTEIGDNLDPSHRLTVLREAEGSLETIAILPNEENPKAIGKPGEDIYAVRFQGERAYIVTFRRIDPLYVLDLSNSAKPVIAGELEVPGFSTYLHPIGEDYLFSVGQEQTGAGQGVKVSLFDVQDIDEPQLINQHLFGKGGSWSEAIYDLRALSFLQTDSDQLRITLPVNVYNYENTTSNGETYYSWSNTGLHLFEVNGLANSQAKLEHVGAIISESLSETRLYPLYSSVDRGTLHNEAVYYIHGNEVWSAFWSHPELATGPH